MILRCSNIRPSGERQPQARARVTEGGPADAGFSQTTLEKGMRMKQFISVLVAAVFAAASMTAIAQDKKADPAEKKASQMDKKDATKGAKQSSTKKPKTKPKSQKGQAKGESTKKPEPK